MQAIQAKITFSSPREGKKTKESKRKKLSFFFETAFQNAKSRAQLLAS